MRVFVTGATGFIGSALVEELIQAGHQVLGMARSDAGAQALKDAGAQVHRADLQDLEGLRSGAAQSDAVIHTAFIHDFSKFQQNCEIDKRAIEALGETLAGSNRPLIVTSGLALLAKGRPGTEQDDAVHQSASMPRVSEATGLSFVDRGVRASVVRLPQVHDPRKAGLISYVIDVARQKGVSAYVGDGSTRWAAVHLHDAAHLYRLVLEKGVGGGRYHAVAEEGVSFRDIADTIGKGLNIPVVSLSQEEAPSHFGFLARFAALDIVATSTQTQQELGWRPTGPSLIYDLQRHFEA